ncbi:MAG: hypothetical protein LIP00_13030 [Parabacteroides sp.]|nr:hypothetical protein [Parabacteroides sp.]
MEGMLTFTGLVVIVFGILQIILFFKIWRMTDDIREIKNKYLNAGESGETASPADSSPLPNKDKTENATFETGELVIRISDGKQMRIKECSNNKYSCYTNNGTVHEGDFSASEIKKFPYKK